MEKYYLIGIKGTGMTSLALILKDLGHCVIGYDDSTAPEFTEKILRGNDIKFYIKESNNEMDEKTIVVRSSAINDDHPEIIKAKELNLEIYDLFEVIGKFTKEYQTIAISGCHGKTTTTSMLTSILDNEIGVNYYIGDGRGKAHKENKTFIAEACEYKRHFFNYKPFYTVITNIDNDHLDYFKDLQEIKDVFEEFANTTEKLIIACGDDKNIRDLTFKKPIKYYGVNENNDIQARNIEYTNVGMIFDAYIDDNLYGSFDLPLFGKHNLENALAVIAICNIYEIPAETVNKILNEFKPAARRFNEIRIDSNIVVDDYAHHSTEVEATINAARQKYPDKKIIAIFEPHSFNRVVDLHNEFANALNKADYAYIMPIYPSRDNPEDYPDVTSDMIIKKITNSELITDETSDKLFKYDNAVFLFMSLKEIFKIKEDLINYLKEK